MDATAGRDRHFLDSSTARSFPEVGVTQSLVEVVGQQVMTPSFTERIRRYFLAHPGRWISSLALQRVGGLCGWRTRLSEVRRWHRMRIEHREFWVTKRDGAKFKASEYRFTPSR